MVDSYSQDAGEKLSPSEYQKAFNQLIIFPGDRGLYEQTFGYPIEVIDTHLRDKGVEILVSSSDNNLQLSNFSFKLRIPLVY